MQIINIVPFETPEKTQAVIEWLKTLQEDEDYQTMVEYTGGTPSDSSPESDARQLLAEEFLR